MLDIKGGVGTVLVVVGNNIMYHYGYIHVDAETGMVAIEAVRDRMLKDSGVTLNPGEILTCDCIDKTGSMLLYPMGSVIEMRFFLTVQAYREFVGGVQVGRELLVAAMKANAKPSTLPKGDPSYS